MIKGLTIFILFISFLLAKQDIEVINGYTLPPEPNKKVNNSTLLGIDVNNNGVRDDVERYIIKRFAQDPKFPKTKTAIAMQYAWASQKILESPTIESNKYLDDAFSCQYYWFSNKQQKIREQIIKLSDSNFSESIKLSIDARKWRSKHEIITDPELEDKILNTKERIEAEFAFNAASSGNIFDGGGADTIDRCQTNIDKLGE